MSLINIYIGLSFFNEDAFLYSLKVSFHLFHPHWLIASPIDLPFCTNWWFSFGTHEAANLSVLRWFAAIYFNGKEWLPSSAPRHLLNDGWTSNSFRTCKYYLIIFTYLINLIMVNSLFYCLHPDHLYRLTWFYNFFCLFVQYSYILIL